MSWARGGEKNNKKKNPRAAHWGTENVALLKDQCSIFTDCWFFFIYFFYRLIVFVFFDTINIYCNRQKKKSKNVTKRRDKQVVSIVSMKVLSHPGRCSSSRLSWGVLFFLKRCPKGFVSSHSSFQNQLKQPMQNVQRKITYVKYLPGASEEISVWNTTAELMFSINEMKETIE